MAGLNAAAGPGMRARASYVRVSAYKVRAMLDLIRGRSCAEAHDILAFSERAASRPIGKVLDSAVANAEHNSGLDADDLYVAACYADEGPTLKRWRARARGRSARIRKRTCHITVVVSRYDEDTLDRMRAERSAARGGAGAGTAESRRRRVARSRQRRGVGAPDGVEERGADEIEAGLGEERDSGEDRDGPAAASSSDSADPTADGGDGVADGSDPASDAAAASGGDPDGGDAAAAVGGNTASGGRER